ncbi:hypothetical protein ACFE04_011806 [Oxalis oulophora]
MDQVTTDNIFERQLMFVATQSIRTTRLGKPPTTTRLQKKAPASLQTSPSSNNTIPIPLLSPLIVSPRPKYSTTTEQDFRFPTKLCSGNNNNSSSIMSIDDDDQPSSIFDCFQSKCVLVANKAQ